MSTSTWIEIYWNSIWLRGRDHTTWFWKCLGTAFGHFLLALTISWSRLLARVWMGPHYKSPNGLTPWQTRGAGVQKCADVDTTSAPLLPLALLPPLSFFLASPHAQAPTSLALRSALHKNFDRSCTPMEALNPDTIFNSAYAVFWSSNAPISSRGWWINLPTNFLVTDESDHSHGRWCDVDIADEMPQPVVCESLRNLNYFWRVVVPVIVAGGGLSGCLEWRLDFANLVAMGAWAESMQVI